MAAGCTVLSEPMVYRVLADAVMLVHLAFIVFVAVGALLAWRWPRLALAHLPALAWGVGTVTIGFPCPLTSLEKALDRRADGDVYDGGFIDRYVEDVVYPGEYSSTLRAFAAALVVIGYVGLRHRRGPAGGAGSSPAPGARRPGAGTVTAVRRRPSPS